MKLKQILTMPNTVFLDTARQDAHNQNTYLFTNPYDFIVARHYSEVADALQKIEKVAQRYWLAGFIAYEAAYAMEEKFTPLRTPRDRKKLPLIWFGVFPKPKELQFPDKRKEQGASLFLEPHPRIKTGISKDAYVKKIKQIQRYIARGDIYQANYTYDSTLGTVAKIADLYAYLRQNQATAYCASINCEYGNILSFSPELFFERNKKTIRVKPMKGTLGRGTSPKEDHLAKCALKCDEKNKAENIMIVDLLRNDLGKVADIGKVETKKIFEVETHPTLHQMTSTITARLKKGVTYDELLRSLFPSGSVTGAPKIRAMEIIKETEQEDRGVYCGAIGYISPRQKAVFSVPIRTLQKAQKEKVWHYRVGSGIIWDSDPAEEWAECQLKTAFLTTVSPVLFDLFETMLWDGRLVYKKEHIERLARSARYFSYPFIKVKAADVCKKIEKNLHGHAQCRVKLILKKSGDFQWSSESHVAAETKKIEYVRKAARAINKKNIFLFHKTSYRPFYSVAMRQIEKIKIFDVLHFNEQEEITEGARTNIFVEKNGILYTPPVSCGLLPGILRARLLKSRKCHEKVLTWKDIESADALFCGNSVRGLRKVVLKK